MARIEGTNTGFRGITKRTNTGKFEVRVRVKDSSIQHSFYVGLKHTLQEAVQARNEFIKNLL